ncbi:hypothetical protein Taro_025503 [Colocasia esculenta]|uniref:Uncharacterized protein n=1 Tax=Colocasia esculenta TaxID=4460 RepID=A0A843VEF6_COLES|nr:hypothetical protein [Colocasia esculenta]
MPLVGHPMPWPNGSLFVEGFNGSPGSAGKTLAELGNGASLGGLNNEDRYNNASARERKGSCNFFMWCDDFLAIGRSCSGKCECNRDEVMQKLVEENEILRKRVQELQLQLEKKTRIAASLGRVISTLTTEEADN